MLGIPYTVLFRIEAIGFPTFGFLLYIGTIFMAKVYTIRVHGPFWLYLQVELLFLTLRLGRCQAGEVLRYRAYV